MEYKGYVNDILNTLIPKDDILHRIEKENTTEHSKKIKSLQNQIEDLKKENEVLKEILTSRFDFNEKNVSNNDIDNIWKTIKNSRNNTVNNKVNNRRFNSIDVSNKYQPICVHKNEVTEPRVNNRMNNNVDKYKDTFNNNIENNVTTRKRRRTTVINQFPERGTLGISEQSKNLVPGYTKYNGAVRFGRKAYVLGTSMVKSIRRNEFHSRLKKCNTRFRPFIGATIKQMETYIKPVMQDDTADVVILHIGCNDISNKNMSANDIAEGVINIGRYCKDHNVNNVTISSLICRFQKHLQHRGNAVNTMLMNRCKNYGLVCIDNSNIEVGFLVQDGLHLNEIGKSYLANNFISFINRYILRYEQACHDSDNCLSNAAQENYIDPQENKPVNSSNIHEENSLDSLR